MTRHALSYRFAEVRRGSRNLRARAAGLPGCWSQGATEAEAIENITAAIKDYLGVAEELLGDAEIREIDVAA